MREINPRHRVPEGDMTRRNPTLKALAEDDLLDAVGKTEVELAYLLRAAVEQTGGTPLGGSANEGADARSRGKADRRAHWRRIRRD